MSNNPERTPDGRYRGVNYRYRNKITGKVWDGESDNEAERKREWDNPHNHNYGGNKITDAREKYGVGPDAWDYEVVEEVFADTHEELQQKLWERETYYIQQDDAVENGYNGSYGRGMQGVKHKPESKAQISKNHRHYQAPSTRKKLSAVGKGHVVTDETKQKISAGNTGKFRTPQQRQAQSQRMKGIEPVAASEGLRNYIQQHGHGPTKGIRLSDNARANMKKAQESRGYDCVCTFPDGHEEEFKTYSAAANAASAYIGHDVNIGSVANCIKSGGKTKDGFKFRKK